MADVDTKSEGGAAAGEDNAVKQDPELARKQELFNSVVASFGYRWGRHGFCGRVWGATLISRAPGPRHCLARPGHHSEQGGRQRVPRGAP